MMNRKKQRDREPVETTMTTRGGVMLVMLMITDRWVGDEKVTRRMRRGRKTAELNHNWTPD